MSDSSIIIDLAKVSLIEAAFQLPYDFMIPDVMFANELLDLGTYNTRDLLDAGLTVGKMASEGVELAFRYSSEYRLLSPDDCFALALAKTTTKAMILTGDRQLREAAGAEGMEARGLLWLCDEMNDLETVDRQVLHDALILLDEDPLIWLPRGELRKRISRLAGKR